MECYASMYQYHKSGKFVSDLRQVDGFFRQ
jgi:hypothetical protein